MSNLLSTKRLHAILSGRVQGVSFRYYTVQTARELSVVGWVCNLPNGSVEVVAEGVETQLAKLLDFLHHGPRLANVEKIDVTWLPATDEFLSFTVRA